MLRHYMWFEVFIGRQDDLVRESVRTKQVPMASGQKVGAFSKSKVIEWRRWTETPYHRSQRG